MSNLPWNFQNENAQKLSFWAQNCQKWPVKTAKKSNFFQKNSIFEVIYRLLELEIHAKVDLLKWKTIPKHFLNNSKRSLIKSRKRLFRPAKCSKMTPQNRQIELIWPKISILGVIYQPLELKINPKVELLGSLTHPKSRTTFKKSKKRLFRPQIGQNSGVKLTKSVDFWVHYQSTCSIFGMLVLKKKLKSSPLIAKAKKKKEKNISFKRKNGKVNKYAHPPTHLTIQPSNE